MRNILKIFQSGKIKFNIILFLFIHCLYANNSVHVDQYSITGAESIADVTKVDQKIFKEILEGKFLNNQLTSKLEEILSFYRNNDITESFSYFNRLMTTIFKLNRDKSLKKDYKDQHIVLLAEHALKIARSEEFSNYQTLPLMNDDDLFKRRPLIKSAITDSLNLSRLVLLRISGKNQRYEMFNKKVSSALKKNCSYQIELAKFYISQGNFSKAKILGIDKVLFNKKSTIVCKDIANFLNSFIYILEGDYKNALQIKNLLSNNQYTEGMKTIIDLNSNIKTKPNVALKHAEKLYSLSKLSRLSVTMVNFNFEVLRASILLKNQELFSSSAKYTKAILSKRKNLSQRDHNYFGALELMGNHYLLNKPLNKVLLKELSAKIEYQYGSKSYYYKNVGEIR
jgi:hypothetical protein